MQAFLIFLVAVVILVILGFLFPSKTNKTPQNSREMRQGSTTKWIEEINSTMKQKR